MSIYVVIKNILQEILINDQKRHFITIQDIELMLYFNF